MLSTVQCHGDVHQRNYHVAYTVSPSSPFSFRVSVEWKFRSRLLAKLIEADDDRLNDN